MSKSGLCHDLDLLLPSHSNLSVRFDSDTKEQREYQTLSKSHSSRSAAGGEDSSAVSSGSRFTPPAASEEDLTNLMHHEDDALR